MISLETLMLDMLHCQCPSNETEDYTLFYFELHCTEFHVKAKKIGDTYEILDYKIGYGNGYH